MEREPHSSLPLKVRKGISAKDLAYRVKRLLPDIQGEKRAKTSAELMTLMGFQAGGTNQRLRAAMKILLLEEGIPVVSSGKGFFVAIRPGECIKYADQCDARALAEHRNAKAARLAARAIQPHQETMFGGGEGE